MAELRDEPRPCEISSHQFSLRGLFHGWIKTDGRMIAVVEAEDGVVSRYDIGNCYSIKFRDK